MAKRSKKKKLAGSRAFKNVTAASVRVQRPAPWSRRDWIWGLILILSVILTYTPVWKAGFIWDDDLILTANPSESSLFYLLSILFFVRWLRAKDLDGRTPGRWSYALTLLFAALAMASKSSTVVLPVVLCLCAWWIEGRLHLRNVARVIPIFLMSVGFSALSIWTQGFGLAKVVTDFTDPQWVRTWPERLAAAGDAVWFYLGKLLWPHPLITIYPRWQIDVTQWFSYLPLLSVIVILAIFWLKHELWSRACFFAFAYFVTALSPVLGLIDNTIFRFSLVFDHFQYLSSIGPLALAGTGLARFSDLIIPKKPWLQSTLCAGLLLILGMASWQRTWVYENLDKVQDLMRQREGNK